MKILERAARLIPGDLLEADGGLHRIMLVERHKDFVWLGCAKHREFWLPNNLEVWIDAPVNLASFPNRRGAGATDVPATFEGERRRRKPSGRKFATPRP